jgi:hypothetical protein
VKRARKRPERRIERQIQAAIVRYHELAVGQDRALLFAVPNGEERSSSTAALLVGQGVVAGAADLVLLLAGGFSVLIEVKRPRSLEPVVGGRAVVVRAGEQSSVQRAFQARAESLGHRYTVIRSLDEYVALLARHGIGRLRPRSEMVAADTTAGMSGSADSCGSTHVTGILRP